LRGIVLEHLDLEEAELEEIEAYFYVLLHD
jgi:hypothetical protein